MEYLELVLSKHPRLHRAWVAAADSSSSVSAQHWSSAPGAAQWLSTKDCFGKVLVPPGALAEARIGTRFFWEPFSCHNARPFSSSNFCASLIFQILQQMRQRSCRKQMQLALNPDLLLEHGRKDLTLPWDVVCAQKHGGTSKIRGYRSGYLIMEISRSLLT